MARCISTLILAFVAVAGPACGGTSAGVGTAGSGATNGTGGTFSSMGATGGVSGGGSSLVITCDNICNNVLATCTTPPLAQGAYSQCLNACQNLDVAQSSCATDFAAYLACLAGANSVQCSGDGQYIVVSPPSCDEQRSAYASCTGGPPLAACIETSPGSPACASHAPRTRTLFCVGLPPADCDPAGGLLGPYCCP